MLNCLSHSSSACIFGSIARGDSDSASDADVLIVGERAADCKQTAQLCQKFGWSCTVYSWRRLAAMASAGSLFVQHLKQDGRVIFDPSERLRDTLASFRPRADYQVEYRSAIEVLAAIERIPASPESLCWAADVLAVVARSAAIAWLGHCGIFEFSKDGIPRALAYTRGLKQSGYDCVRRLRILKHQYRARSRSAASCPPALLSQSDLTGLCNDVDQTFGIGAHLTFESPRRYLSDFALLSDDAPWYAQMRKCESAFIVLEGTFGMQTRFESESLYAWKNAIQRPVEYGWTFGALRRTFSETIGKRIEAAVAQNSAFC